MYTLSWGDPKILYFFEGKRGKTLGICQVVDDIAYASILDITSPSAPTSVRPLMPRRPT